MMDQIKYLLALESYKFMHTNIVHVRMIMINILYTSTLYLTNRPKATLQLLPALALYTLYDSLWHRFEDKGITFYFENHFFSFIFYTFAK